MKADRVFETVIYARDLSAAERFYGGILGMEVIQKSELFLTFRMSRSVLLIFDPVLSAESGRSEPSHGKRGEGHSAFAPTDEEIDAWKTHFEQAGIEVEQIRNWDEGGRSLYVRDPAGNSVEFSPGTLWGGGWGF